MNVWRKYAIEGAQDLLFDQCEVKNEVIYKCRKVFRKYGFNEVQTPTLEFYDVFNFSNHPIDDEKIYKLVDFKGRILTLRPDLTIPIARVYSTKLKTENAMLSYVGDVYRANEHNHGRNNQITQCGIEIIGISNIKAEILLILTAIDTFKEIGIEEFKIEIGQCKFFKGILETLSFDKEEVLELESLIMNKNLGSLYSFLNTKRDKLDDDQYRLLKVLPQLFGGKDVIAEAEELVNSEKALNALRDLRYIYNTLESLGYSQYISLDLAMIQSFNYYTGAIFKGYIKELGEEILSGGRYDGLVGEFGEASAAAGLAINVDEVQKLLYEREKLKKPEEVTGVIFFEKDSYANAIKIMNLLNKGNGNWRLNIQENFEEVADYCRTKGIQRIMKVNSNEVIEYRLNPKGVFIGEMFKNGEY
ncbi:ATP phosphoribosyltransferase regulatory subunit [Clostridium manihotivorum]|uniref:ATP phosphoribosyltransferase regulatory subunit n=1 Tax=Clostridium manihotivorum TaxID=2320868 RepID=A0A3R5QXI3_9CLOT|nr:ATP phosphoribosyltransferase regulatory subunit [Clostridium manihotivorum]QAA34983.1 ATP phosphoribosyltransferase regulatory subunit [Clostridium manihotivorum]